MSREASITYEDVAAAATALQTAGVSPTARHVRERLGSGSMSTINRCLQTWRDGQTGAVPPSSSSAPLPEAHETSD